MEQAVTVARIKRRLWLLRRRGIVSSTNFRLMQSVWMLARISGIACSMYGDGHTWTVRVALGELLGMEKAPVGTGAVPHVASV